ncbi:response regulator [Sulfurimonas sp.]|jgi:diguanylate cyclase (GGDEF)-like protein|uniref:response regulator n=1 Tax=Sulfurimonas sp. TaxID=2022749 RepID=UPI0025E7B478|nr:response regulator [Sulfurimonas sp.]MBT5933731.1 diguanylate cyclase [Sulfurimonas sp.]
MKNTRKKILIVDDSKVVRSMVKKALDECQEIDADLIFTESYAQTQEIVQKHRFHIAILDVTLPDAQNGEVIDLLTEQDVPVVVLTGGISNASKNIILKKNIMEYITKSNPQSLDYIVTIAKRILKNYDAHVLIIDASKSLRLLTKLSLEKLNLCVLEAKSAKEAIEILRTSEQYIPLVITDYSLPDMDGMELTMELRQIYSKDKLSIIALSGSNDPIIASKFLRHGANDFIKKPYTHEEFSLRINVNLELIDLFRQSKETASKDFLTGLYNRRFFFESGIPILEKTKRKSLSIAVATIDIDFFKKINDTYGHDIGDVAIKEVANILKKHLRSSDLIARFGGEEFCILLDDISEEKALNKFEDIRAAFESNILSVSGATISYTVSIGLYYGNACSLEDMLTLSDKALYEAKETGRNKVIIHKKS